MDALQVENLEGRFQGRTLDLPASALLCLSGALPGVAGGPADPEAWDRWFGAQDTFAAGEAESLARRRKAEALPPRLAALYREVARMRQEGHADFARLLAIRDELSQFPQDWLLCQEVGELLDTPAT